ncbi:MAG: IS110 family transposase [Gemmatimonadota bacterium]
MDVFVERCAGIDIGKADLKACVRTPGVRRGSRRQEVRTFSTTTAGLLRLREWLVEQQVSLVGMESTGVYWKPVFYLLEDAVECWLVNPQHVKKVPGRKSDVSDAAWLAQLVEHGLVRPSFVPPPPIRSLRDLTRYRAVLTHERTREVQRLHAVLEDAGVKLDCVASDIMGASGRAMIAALIRGERDERVLADLARTKLRRKIPALREALTGHFTDHHALLCQMMLDRIDGIDAAIARLDAQIDTEMAPFRDTIKHLITIPGVGKRTAEVIIAETGGDMTRFVTPEDLCSWAGMCPGNNESAGKHFTGRTRKGDRWLRGALGEAAAAAAKTKNTYLAARYARILRRRGKKRAQVAVGHTILASAWHVMTHGADYADLGADHFTRLGNPDRRAQRLIAELQHLGYRIEPPAAA